MASLLAVAVAWFARGAVVHLRAAAILARASGETGFLARRFNRPFTTESRSIFVAGRTLRARAFVPLPDRAPGVIILHGVQCIGIDDARVIALARSFASAGYAVLTPEIPSLADMRLSPDAVGEIRAAVNQFASEPRVDPHRVVLIGASFAGGLALRAAADSVTRAHLAAVISVGGHHDLGEVLRYLAGIESGSSAARHRPPPFPYGLQVFARSYADRLVSDSDAPMVRDALGAALCADAPRARSLSAGASPDARRVLDDLERGDRRDLAPRVALALPALQSDIAAMSPAGHLRALGDLPVFVLHGANDDVIPSSESEDLARELAGDPGAHVLIQRAIQHVDVRADASRWERWRLVHLLARILATIS